MSRWSRRGLIVLALALGAFLSAFLGGSVGFLQGYGYGLGDTASKAVTLTGALKSLRAGKMEEGIPLLESSLDVLVMEHWAANRGGPPALSWVVRNTRNSKVERTLFAAVARYRTEHPPSPTAEAADVQDIISSHLRSFQTP